MCLSSFFIRPELIVHENTDVMSVGDSLARDDGAEGGVCLVDILEEQISEWIFVPLWDREVCRTSLS